MSKLNQYLERLIESKKLSATIAKRNFDHRTCHYEQLSEDEQAELIKLAISEDEDTRADLRSNLQSLLTDALERIEETEAAEEGMEYASARRAYGYLDITQRQ